MPKFLDVTSISAARNALEVPARSDVVAAAAMNSANAADFSVIQRVFASPYDGLWLARDGDDYTFMAGLGTGRYTAFYLPQGAYSLNGVTYTTNFLRGLAVTRAMLSQDDTTATFSGSGTWTNQPAIDEDTGYLQKTLTVTTTSGSGTVTITTGTITSGDTGRRVVISGAGSGGADLTTTLTYVDATTFTVGTLPSSSGSGRSATVWPTYRYNATAGATATWTSPANTVAVGMGVVKATNGGLGKVTLSGSASGAVTANALKTAQDVVDEGIYPSSILVANGGSLAPTDRVIDFYPGLDTALYDQRIAIADNLAADTWTLTVTGTGYQATNGTDSRIYADRFSYALADTTLDTANAELFTTDDFSPYAPSAFEMAMDCRPASGGTYTFVGQAAHQLEEQQSLTVVLDGVTATPTDGSVTSCRTAQIRRVTHLFHPDSGAALTDDPIAEVTYIYDLSRSGLSLSVGIEFLIDLEVRTGFGMMPLRGPASTGGINRVAMHKTPSVGEMTGSDTNFGLSPSAFFTAWNDAGYVGVGMFAPDMHNLTGNFANGTVSWPYIQDRASGNLVKGYWAWDGVNTARTYAAGDTRSYQLIYFAGYFAGGADSALSDLSAPDLTNATGLPLSGLVSSASTALGVGSLNVGHESDTTLTRSSAGILAVEGVDLASLLDIPLDLESGENTFPRRMINIAGLAPGNGNLRLTYFTARRTETVATVRTSVAVASSSATLARIGIYSVAENGDLTLVASTANDATLWDSTGEVEKALSDSFTKTRGTRYAVGLLVVGSSTATNLFANGYGQSAELAKPPRLSGVVTGQTDLPATVSAASVSDTGQQYYVALVP